MDDTQNFQVLHPSVLQMQYLQELERTGARRGCIALIADACGVSHAPVSKFFKECVRAGYLTEKYEFTENGQRACRLYRMILTEVRRYLEFMEVRQEDIPQKLRQLVENVDYELLLQMARKAGEIREPLRRQNEEQAPYFLEKVLEKGNYEVAIAIHRVNGDDGVQLSMAHRGFDHIACIRNNNRGSWLELTAFAVSARSRLDGGDIIGYLDSLKYENQGKLYATEIRNGKVRIPLSACRFLKSRHGNVKGTIPITVTCTAGKAHMPESTALLTFWM